MVPRWLMACHPPWVLASAFLSPRRNEMRMTVREMIAGTYVLPSADLWLSFQSNECFFFSLQVSVGVKPCVKLVASMALPSAAV